MSLYMFGTMLFTPILTQLADLYGRRITYLMTFWLAILANIGCILASNYIIFMIFIFIAGIGATVCFYQNSEITDNSRDWEQLDL